MEIKTFTYQKVNGAYYLYLPGQCHLMDAHIQTMLQEGWEPINSANDPGHVRVGKTLALTALTGGISLFFGASRTAQTIAITFKRAVPPPFRAHVYCCFCGTPREPNADFC